MRNHKYTTTCTVNPTMGVIVTFTRTVNAPSSAIAECKVIGQALVKFGRSVRIIRTATERA